MHVEVKSKVIVDTSHDKVKVLYDVQFVSDLGYNLISIGQLITDKYSLRFDDNVCVITNKKSGKKVRITMTPNNIFSLDVSNMKNFALAASAKDDSKLWHLRKYARDLLIKFGLLNCKPAATLMNIGEKLQLNDGAEIDDARGFRSLVGGLIYLTHTRSDITFSVGVISRLCGFTDSDYAGSLDDRQSILAHVLTLDLGVVTWSSKKQATTTSSTSEIEYIVATLAACQAIWLRKMLAELQNKPRKCNRYIL
ncbi:hypothetical protein BC332_28954 [Capsicum chinense]|nr:hypothetical protein BC332_28954 [Capsicum chinense]